MNTIHITFFKLHDLFRGPRDGDMRSVLFALGWLVLGKWDARQWISLSAGVSADSLEAVSAHKDVQSVLQRMLANLTEEERAEAAKLVSQIDYTGANIGAELQGIDWNKLHLPALSADLCDLAVACLAARPGDTVWVPVDPLGQFTQRLIKKQVHVLRAGSLDPAEATDLSRLLLALEEESTELGRLTFESQLPKQGVSHCLVASPIGAKVDPARESARWGIPEAGAPIRPRMLALAQESFRQETWALAAAWAHVTCRGVFVTSQSLLFSRGQEQRVRKALLLNAPGNMVAAAVHLPAGSLISTGIQPGLLVLANENHETIRAIDLSGRTGSDVTSHQLGKDISAADAAILINSDTVIPQIAANLTAVDVEECDHSLLPQRYLRRVRELAGARQPLGEVLLSVVRAPTPSKEPTDCAVWEIGSSLLDRWAPIVGGYERFTRFAPRKAAELLLREGDIVFSVKGAVGKVGMVGAIPNNTKAVTSHKGDEPGTMAAIAASNCIALRADRQQILPEYLLMYLRSTDFQQQLDALRVGSVMVHITPAALLSGVQIPTRSLEEQRSMCEKYHELCELEQQIEQVTAKMRDLSDALFAA